MSRGCRAWWRWMSTRPCVWRRCRSKFLGAELRWILLVLSLPLLAGIWWWTARRAGQTPGNAELRESTAGKPAEAPTPLPPDPRYIDPNDGGMRPAPASRDWGVPPFEPLNIHTADFEHVPLLDGPMTAGAEPAPSAVPP